MNIFYLNSNPKTCASYHVDKHTVKMIVEYAQLLSTAHRVLDGVLLTGISDSGRKTTSWILPDDRDAVLYRATHINHPSAVWVRQSISNYMWLSHLLVELCKEYTYRYGKVHKCERDGLTNTLLNNVPKNISNSIFTEPTPAMDVKYKVKGDSIQSYINYYNGDKRRMFSWKNREVPYFVTGEV